MFDVEILFNSSRIPQSLHKLWGDELVSLANSCSCSIRSIQNICGVGLSPERFIYRDGEQGDKHSEHFQAILFEVGLQGYVLERV